VVEQILGVSLELALGVQREAAAKAIGGAFVEHAGVEIDAGRAAAGDLVRGELVAPAEGVPQASIVAAGCDCAIEAREPFCILVAPRDQRRAEMFERLRVFGVDLKRTARQRDASGDVACLMACACLLEQCARVVGWCQPSASTSFNSSCSVNTRNEDVRTLPWLLTDIDTRDIVSSSGASAMTT